MFIKYELCKTLAGYFNQFWDAKTLTESESKNSLPLLKKIGPRNADLNSIDNIEILMPQPAVSSNKVLQGSMFFHQSSKPPIAVEPLQVRPQVK